MRTEFSVEQQEQKALAESIHVGTLCRVEAFNPSKMTVDVQPLSKALDGGIYRTPPPVLGVPVALIKGGGFILRPWYQTGDTGVLLYLDHDIDRIADSGQEAQPNTERNHSDEDAIFVGAFNPASKPITGLPGEALVMAVEGGSVYVAVSKERITLKGDVTIEGDITHKGDTSQTGSTTATGDVVASGISLKSHTHMAPHGATSGPS